MKHVTSSVVLALSLIATPLAVAQSKPEPTYSPPQTSWGVPDLQGFFSSASITTMSRPASATGLVVSAEEAEKLFDRNIYTRVAKDEAGKSEHKLLTDANPDRGYNRFWWDPGADLGKIGGQYRSSWIIEPANGQIPYKNEQARSTRSAVSEEEYADLGSDNPEDRGGSERCIWGFTGGSGPVLFNGMYNNNYQIVQTPGHVMIVSEMIHDTRIIPIDGQHNPDVVPKWGGDSVGHYEGNTLVVETTNVMPRQNSLISQHGKVTERFTRVSESQVLYAYTVEDPSLYSQAWKGEMPLNVATQGPYEYACHEGNYSMNNLLTGARAYERAGRVNGARKSIFAGLPEEDEVK